LLRQLFPKQTNFKIVNPEALEKAVKLSDNRPRKSLGYQTPFEVFSGNKSDSDALQV
jgi:transposase, IS30 family